LFFFAEFHLLAIYAKNYMTQILLKNEKPMINLMNGWEVVVVRDGTPIIKKVLAK
jgi:hypothetical protein